MTSRDQPQKYLSSHFGESPLYPILTFFTKLGKWYFDIMKNILVVAGLGVLAHKFKLNNVILNIVANLSFIILLLYSANYIYRWEIKPFSFIKHNKLREVFNLVFSAIMSGFIFYMYLFILPKVLHELALQ